MHISRIHTKTNLLYSLHSVKRCERPNFFSGVDCQVAIGRIWLESTPKNRRNELSTCRYASFAQRSDILEVVCLITQLDDIHCTEHPAINLGPQISPSVLLCISDNDACHTISNMKSMNLSLTPRLASVPCITLSPLRPGEGVRNYTASNASFAGIS